MAEKGISQHKRLAMGQKLAKGGAVKTKVESGKLTPVEVVSGAPMKKGGKCCK